jgi:DNA-binding CsgD family transcriptional regulator
MAKRPPHVDPDKGPPLADPTRSSIPFRWRLTPSEEKDPVKVVWALQERIKELNCLYAIAQLAERGEGPIEDILEVVVTIIPPSWQYPDITCARIDYQGAVYMSPGFTLTRWCQSAPIHLQGEPVGEVTVCYTEETPQSFEGPFLHEERVLLDAIAERIGAIAMRINAERELNETNRQLMVERKALQETNAALRTVGARVEDEKREIYRDIRDNVEKVLMPIVHELYMSVPRNQRKFVELLRDNLEDISSPFVSRLSTQFQSLTPTEIQISNMIRNGMRTKEVAELRGVSMATVHRHRERIRQKLGLTNSDINLATFLRMNM